MALQGILKQYNHQETVYTGTVPMFEPITYGVAKSITLGDDLNVISVEEEKAGNNLAFDEEYLSCMDKQFVKDGGAYYFHGRIKRMAEYDQRIYVKLINYVEGSIDNKAGTQYIKTLNIKAGIGWVDVEFIFKALGEFNGILFQLQRTVEADYQLVEGAKKQRRAAILYVQLAQMKNIIPSLPGAPNYLLKMGVDANPGLMMCVNGEEIHVGRTGFYEVRNNTIAVNSFSVMCSSPEKGKTLAERQKDIEDNIEKDDKGDYNTYSFSIVNQDKEYKMDGFTLDYVFNNNVIVDTENSEGGA